MSNSGEQEKPEIVVVPSKKVTEIPGAFEALMKFQYGDGEDSDRGFEEFNRLVSEDDSTTGTNEDENPSK